MPESFHLLTSVVEKSIGAFPPYPTYGIGSFVSLAFVRRRLHRLKPGRQHDPILTLVINSSQIALDVVSKRPPREYTYIGLVPKISAGSHKADEERTKRLETCHMQATASILVMGNSGIATIFARKAAC